MKQSAKLVKLILYAIIGVVLLLMLFEQIFIIPLNSVWQFESLESLEAARGSLLALNIAAFGFWCVYLIPVLGELVEDD